jgi:small subunit ribosomal protein S3
MKKVIRERYQHAGIADVGVERVGPKIRVIIHTARPGIVIGRGGKEIESLKLQNLSSMLSLSLKGSPFSWKSE